MNLNIEFTNSMNKDFIELTGLLDKDLQERYGELQKHYEKHNRVEHINNVVVAYIDKIPAACGGFKEYDSHTIEIKRVFVRKEYRRQGFAGLIVGKLEQLAKESGYRSAVLETGVRQHEAINLYKSMGYEITANYGPYVGNMNSICMKKDLNI